MADQIQNIKVKYVIDDDDMDKATKGLQGMSTAEKEVTDNFKKVNTEANKAHKEIADGSTKSASISKALGGEIKNLAGGINIMGVNAGQAFNSLNNGLGGAVKGLGVFKIALASTGIGLLIVAVGSLIAYFKSTEKGSEQLERAMAGIGAAVGVVIGKFAKLGEGIFAIFRGDFAKGVDILKSAFTGVIDEMGKASDEARAYTRVLQGIEDEEKNLQVEIEKSITKRKQLAIAALNAGEESKEGVALLRQAVEIEKTIVDKQLALQQRKVNQLKIMNDQALAKGTVDQGNELDAYREAQVEFERIKGQSLEIIGKLENKQARLSLKDQKAAHKEKLEAEKKFLKDIQGANEDTLVNQIHIEEQKTQSLDKSFQGQKGLQSIFSKSFKKDMDQSVKDYVIVEKAKSDELKKAEQERTAIRQAGIQAVSTLVNSFAEIERNKNQQALEESQLRRDKELKQVGDNKQAQAQINAKFDREERKLKREQALTDRNLAIFNIALSTAQAIAKANPVVPLMAFAGIMGAAQLAVVASKPIPKFNKGTKSVPGVDLGDDSVLAMVRPTEKIFPVSTSRQYEPALDAIFDRKIPASLINSFALDYDRVGGIASKSISINNNSEVVKELHDIKKTLSNLPVTNVTLDKKGVKSFVRQNRSETEFVNNYFKR